VLLFWSRLPLEKILLVRRFRLGYSDTVNYSLDSNKTKILIERARYKETISPNNKKQILHFLSQEISMMLRKRKSVLLYVRCKSKALYSLALRIGFVNLLSSFTPFQQLLLLPLIQPVSSRFVISSWGETQSNLHVEIQ
jgi:hypothetical protein